MSLSAQVHSRYIHSQCAFFSTLPKRNYQAFLVLLLTARQRVHKNVWKRRQKKSQRVKTQRTAARNPNRPATFWISNAFKAVKSERVHIGRRYLNLTAHQPVVYTPFSRSCILLSGTRWSITRGFLLVRLYSGLEYVKVNKFNAGLFV